MGVWSRTVVVVEAAKSEDILSDDESRVARHKVVEVSLMRPGPGQEDCVDKEEDSGDLALTRKSLPKTDECDGTEPKEQCPSKPREALIP